MISNLGPETTSITECSDTNNEKTGRDGKGCSEYEATDCGNQDDNDFDSSQMCCNQH